MRATSSGPRRDLRPCMVAATTFWGLLERRHLVRMSLMPAVSSTARTGPPAITPVPGAAGLSNTRPAPNSPITSWGMVVPDSVTLIMFFLASSMPLRIASGTSAALPRPKPTRPFSSPTTMRAANLKIRPPLTVLLTRFRETSFSVNSLGSLSNLAMFVLSSP